MDHVTETDFQQYSDGTLGASEASAVEKHLEECNECAARLVVFRSIETELRKIPLEKVSGKFTERVMRAVGLREAPGFLRSLFVNFLPLATAFVALLVILGRFTGGPAGEDPVTREATSFTQSLYQSFGLAASAGAGRLLDWVQKGVGLFVAIPSLKFIALLLLAFGVVALFDEFVFIPLMKKRG